MWHVSGCEDYELDCCGLVEDIIIKKEENHIVEPIDLMGVVMRNMTKLR
jgi:hypothetical protein